MRLPRGIIGMTNEVAFIYVAGSGVRRVTLTQCYFLCQPFQRFSVTFILTKGITHVIQAPNCAPRFETKSHTGPAASCAIPSPTPQRRRSVFPSVLRAPNGALSASKSRAYAAVSLDESTLGIFCRFPVPSPSLSFVFFKNRLPSPTALLPPFLKP